MFIDQKPAMFTLELLVSLSILTVVTVPMLYLTTHFVYCSIEIDQSLQIKKQLYQAILSKTSQGITSDEEIVLSSGYAKITKEGKIIEIKKK